MLRQITNRYQRFALTLPKPSPQTTRLFSTPDNNTNDDTPTTITASQEEDLRARYAYHHFSNPKPRLAFKIPRKRATSLFHTINTEATTLNTASKPKVLQVPFRVGDAVEIEMVAAGGVNSKKMERARGVVIGRVNRGLASSVTLRDVLWGVPIERQIMLHSPMVKSLKVLEENFLFKGRRKVKRAKLYYLRDRLPTLCKVTK